MKWALTPKCPRTPTPCRHAASGAPSGKECAERPDAATWVGETPPAEGTQACGEPQGLTICIYLIYSIHIWVTDTIIVILLVYWVRLGFLRCAQNLHNGRGTSLPMPLSWMSHLIVQFDRLGLHILCMYIIYDILWNYMTYTYEYIWI